jgi:alpha-ribazole phosphatase
MSEARFWLVRHAPVDGERRLIHPPAAAASLDDRMACDAIRARLPPGASWSASPSRRTRDTAAALGGDGARLEPLLREQDFGAWTGQRHEELEAADRDAYRAFWSEPATNRPPGGESFVDQIARVGRALEALAAGNHVLVVHSGTIRAVLAIGLDLSPDRALSFVIDPWSLTRVDRVGGGWRVGCVNWLPAPTG